MPARAFKTIPLRRISVDTSAGADPDAIDDATEAVGEIEEPNFLDEVFEQCPVREEGKQCIYSWQTNFMDCVYCGKPSGLED